MAGTATAVGWSTSSPDSRRSCLPRTLTRVIAPSIALCASGCMLACGCVPMRARTGSTTTTSPVASATRATIHCCRLRTRRIASTRRLSICWICSRSTLHAPQLPTIRTILLGYSRKHTALPQQVWWSWRTGRCRCPKAWSCLQATGEILPIARRSLFLRPSSCQGFRALHMTRDPLLPEIAPNAEHARSVFYLAQNYFDAGDFVNARKWYARRAEMGGWAEEVYYSLYRVAAAMAHLGEPWPDVQDAYLRAWAFRPTRAEPLYQIAVHYRVEQHYQLGYLFAERATAIPLPEEDILFVDAALCLVRHR